MQLFDRDPVPLVGPVRHPPEVRPTEADVPPAAAVEEARDGPRALIEEFALELADSTPTGFSLEQATSWMPWKRRTSALSPAANERLFPPTVTSVVRYTRCRRA